METKADLTPLIWLGVAGIAYYFLKDKLSGLFDKSTEFDAVAERQKMFNQATKTGDDFAKTKGDISGFGVIDDKGNFAGITSSGKNVYELFNKKDIPRVEKNTGSTYKNIYGSKAKPTILSVNVDKKYLTSSGSVKVGTSPLNF